MAIILLCLVGCGGRGTADSSTNGLAPDPTAPIFEEIVIDPVRYQQDLAFIAQAPRDDLSPHHDVVADLCAERFEALGFQVERQDYESGVNIVGTLPGKTSPQEILVVSAHYDSVSDCNGADDNASGVAGVLETARVLSYQEHDRTLVVACWDDEEKGLDVFDKQARPMALDIVAAANLDGLPIVSLVVDLDGYVIPALRCSDHVSFWDQGYSAIIIGDTGDLRATKTIIAITGRTMWTLLTWILLWR